MKELEKLISIYHTAYIVCLVLAIVCLVISIFLFFKFKIKKIFDDKTGRGAKRTIQRMEEINARTGKLRQDMVAHTPVTLRPEERITYPVTAANPQVHSQAASDQDATTPLAAAGSEETSVLFQEAETTLLSAQTPAPETKVKKELPGRFEVVKEVMWVHTKEVL